MGDYLYALGNAQGWIHDTRDPLVILDLFKKAAKKGSSDAEIVVGLFYFFGIIPSQNQYTVGLPKQFRDIELGSKLIREGIKKRCAYAEPVPGNDGVYLRYVSGAGRIWHFYRDGQNDIDASGKFYPVIKPDNRLEKEWHDLDKQCKQSGATTD
jgi:hypothetical protein